MLISPSSIHLRNIYTGIDIRGTSDTSGTFIIPSLRADVYQMTVQAAHHAGQEMAVDVVEGMEEIRVFLARTVSQACTYICWARDVQLHDGCLACC